MSQDQESGRDQLVACSKEQWKQEKMSIYSNRQMCESVCKKESTCGECMLQPIYILLPDIWLTPNLSGAFQYTTFVLLATPMSHDLQNV